MTTIADLDAMRPLDPDDETFPVAISAMKDALSRPITRSPGPLFWLLDQAGADVSDVVTVVDLVSLGYIARGSVDWASYGAGLRLIPMNDRHAATDVLETLMRRLGELKAAPPIP